jgi:glycine oxidase
MTPDVIIVGAGIIGCACAHSLAAEGAQVRVVDTRGVGQGASQASAGVLAPFIEGHESGPLRQLGQRSLGLFERFVREAGEASGLPIPHARAGTLEIALDQDSAIGLTRLADQLMAAGITARWLDGPQLKAAEPLVTVAARGALLIPSHAFVAVPDLTQALAAAATRHGAVFALETRVRAIDTGPGGRLAVETEDGVSFADVVVIATGSWTRELQVVETPASSVKPIRGQLLYLQWPAGRASRQPISHVLWGRDCYLVPWADGRVLVGATVEDVGFDERTTADGVHGLLGAACTLVPELAQASFLEARAGLRPASGDDRPIVGRSTLLEGLIYATGHYRNGVLLAPLTAALVSDLVFGRPYDPALDLMSPSRFGSL